MDFTGHRRRVAHIARQDGLPREAKFAVARDGSRRRPAPAYVASVLVLDPRYRDRRVGRGVALLVTLTLLLTGTAEAIAQRGDAPDPETVPSRLDGIPGLFRVATVPRRELQISGPLLNLQYGLTDELSVGLHLLPMAALVTGGFGAIAELDYRMALGERWLVGLGVTAGYGSVPTDKETYRASLLLARATVEHRISARQAVTATVLVGDLAPGSIAHGDLEGAYQWAHLRGLAVAAGYIAFPLDWLGIEINAAGAPLTRVATDTVQSIDMAPIDLAWHQRLVGRAVVHLRPGRRWLLSVGAMSSTAALGTPLPWLGVTRRF